MGVITVEQALTKAKEAGLDLIEVSANFNPPVARIMNRGKNLYEQEKKERQASKRRKEVELKNIRIGIGTSIHDLEMKAKQADEFLKGGNKIKVDLALRGREKYLDKKFLEERIVRLVNLIATPIEVEPAKKGPRGLSVTINVKK